jgi:hypothetical protein
MLRQVAAWFAGFQVSSEAGGWLLAFCPLFAWGRAFHAEVCCAPMITLASPKNV